MTEVNRILAMAEENNGIITTAMAVNAGCSRASLKYLTDQGKLERTARGVYGLPDAWEDEFVTLQARFKRGIFSLGTALFLLGLTDRTPNRYHMTFPAHYNLANPKKAGVQCNSAIDTIYFLGVTQVITPVGNRVNAYNAERTLCDLIRPRNNTDIQLISEAFKTYLARKDRNIPQLSEYAKSLKVEERVRRYLEVLM
jgi:predicted transcriptional regulator of viral defense system